MNRRDSEGLAGAGAPDRGSRSAPGWVGARRAYHHSPARVSPARPDRDGRDASAPRALEPARALRHRWARAAALEGQEARRVQRLRLPDRVAPPASRPDAAQPARDYLRPRPLAPELRAGERGLPPLRAA